MIDWNEDEWFAKHHTENVTIEFAAWWISKYGIPKDFEDHASDPSEYWTRCGFALMGWLAAEEYNS